MLDIVLVAILLVAIIIKFYSVLGKDANNESGEPLAKTRRVKLFGVIPTPIKKKEPQSISYIGEVKPPVAIKQKQACAEGASCSVDVKSKKSLFGFKAGKQDEGQNNSQLQLEKLQALKQNIEKLDIANKAILQEDYKSDSALLEYDDFFKKYPSLDLKAIKDSAVLFFEDLSLSFQDGAVDHFSQILSPSLLQKLNDAIKLKTELKNSNDESKITEVSLLYKVSKASYANFNFANGNLRLDLKIEGLKINYKHNQAMEVVGGSKISPAPFCNTLVLARAFGGAGGDAQQAKWIAEDIL